MAPRVETCPVWDAERIAAGEKVVGRFMIVDYLGPEAGGGQYLAYDETWQQQVFINVAANHRTVTLLSECKDHLTTSVGAPKNLKRQEERPRTQTVKTVSPFVDEESTRVDELPWVEGAPRLGGSGIVRLRRRLKQGLSVEVGARDSGGDQQPPDVDQLLKRLQRLTTGEPEDEPPNAVVKVKHARRRHPPIRKPLAARTARKVEAQAAPAKNDDPAPVPTERVLVDDLALPAPASRSVQLTPSVLPGGLDDEPTEELRSSRGRRVLQVTAVCSMAGAVALLLLVPWPSSTPTTSRAEIDDSMRTGDQALAAVIRPASASHKAEPAPPTVNKPPTIARASRARANRASRTKASRRPRVSSRRVAAKPTGRSLTTRRAQRRKAKKRSKRPRKRLALRITRGAKRGSTDAFLSNPYQ